MEALRKQIPSSINECQCEFSVPSMIAHHAARKQAGTEQQARYSTRIYWCMHYEKALWTAWFKTTLAMEAENAALQIHNDIIGKHPATMKMQRSDSLTDQDKCIMLWWAWTKTIFRRATDRNKYKDIDDWFQL